MPAARRIATTSPTDEHGAEQEPRKARCANPPNADPMPIADELHDRPGRVAAVAPAPWPLAGLTAPASARYAAASGTVCSSAMRHPRRASIASPTISTIAIPDAGAHRARRDRQPARSRRARSTGPSWSASNSCARPNTSAPDERDLERDHDVLGARAEHHEDAGDERCHPRPHAGPPHHRAEQARGGEVQGDQHELVRDVRADAEQRPQQPVREDGSVVQCW